MYFSLSIVDLDLDDAVAVVLFWHKRGLSVGGKTNLLAEVEVDVDADDDIDHGDDSIGGEGPNKACDANNVNGEDDEEPPAAVGGKTVN